MSKGGYSILNLRGANLSTSPLTVDGVYERLEVSMKAILVENFLINGIDQASFFAAKVAVSGGDFALFKNTASTGVVYLIRVTAEDKVFIQTYNPSVPSAG